MPDISDLVKMVSGVPVVTAPAEIDVSTAEQLRAVVSETAASGHSTVVVDMTGTRFCDSSGLDVLVRAHKRALEEGGQLRLVIPTDGVVSRIYSLTSRYRFIPRFGSLQEALRQSPAAIRPLRPPPSPQRGSPAREPGSPARQPGSPDADREPVAEDVLEVSVADGECGPVITLYGEADLTSAARLRALLNAQLSGETRHLTIDVAGLSFADSASGRRWCWRRGR